MRSPDTRTSARRRWRTLPNAVAPLCWGLAMLAAAAGAADDEPAGSTSDYLGPVAVAASSDGRTLYVAEADARQVARVEPPVGRIVRWVDMPGEPTGLALTPDGKRLIVTCAAPASTVLVLDAASGGVLANIPAGHTAMCPVVSPDGTRLYVLNRFNNDVAVIDLAAGKEVGRVPVVREPVAAAVTPDGQALLVANHLPNTRTDMMYRGEVAPEVTLIDTATLKTTAIPLPGGANSLRGLCVSPDGRHAFVTHVLSNFQLIPFRVDMGWINLNVVSVIDLAERKRTRTVGLDEVYLGAGNPWAVASSDDGRWLCVTQSGSHELSVIATSVLMEPLTQVFMTPLVGAIPAYPSMKASLWRRIKLPGKGPRGMAIAGSTVYVAEYFSDTLAVVELENLARPEPAPPASIPLGPPPRMSLARRGELLFHDATICYQHWQSCASCHPDGRADGLVWDLLNDGSGNPKNTKSMLYAHETPPAMAEGVRMTAEEAVVAGLEHILFSYRPDEHAPAIDEYLKTLRPVPSPHLVDGRLSPAAERGRRLFGSDRVGCHRCHPEPLYTDQLSHNVGTRSPYEVNERFDTPTLVEVWRTAPYLHDGRYTTIESLLAEGRHGLSGDEAKPLSAEEIADLTEFVLSL